jgi:hypothetical protein
MNPNLNHQGLRPTGTPRKSRNRIAAAVAAALITSVVAQNAFTQSAEGSVYGRTSAGATVTIVSPSTGVSRSTTAGSDGNFTVTRLPPGNYTVTADGKSTEVVVRIGTGTGANFEDELAEVLVVGVTQRVIDFSSTESTSVFTQQMIQNLPVPLDVNAVATLTPTVLRGDAGLGSGDLPSFAGSSVAENAYYVNGFDVTNIRNFLSYAELPYESIAQQQVKTGGYGAEFGRSLGGVISLATRRGTNEWEGGVSLSYTPDSMRASGQNVRSREPSQPGVFLVYDAPDYFNESSIGAYVGGPIIPDRLFFFAMIQKETQEERDFAQSTAVVTESGTPTGLLKIDWNIADGHLLELTGIFNKKRFELTDYTNATPFSTKLDGTGRDSWYYEGGTVGIAKYTGSITDNFTVSVLGGYVSDLTGVPIEGARTADQSCPVVLETNLSEIGCWSGPFPGSPIRVIGAPPDEDERMAGRIDFEYQLGAHQLRAGYDAQQFESTEAGGSTYSGGHYYRYFIVPASGAINGVAGFTPGTQYVRDRVIESTSGTFEVRNTAFYVEDNWEATDNLHLYAGLRSESFDNRDGDGNSFVKQDNLLAPRLGFSYRLPGDNPTKLYGTAGRYYIPVASNTNIRMTRGELFTHHYFQFASRNPVTQGPVGLGPSIGNPQINGDGSLPDPATVADTDLQPMNQDEFILGIQHTIDAGWTFGAKVMYRKLNDGMDDFCGHGAFQNYADDQGYTNFDVDSMAQCVLINPGNDVHINMDIDGSGDYVEQNVPSDYFGLAKYTRTYKALELSVEKPFNGKWGIAGSYVWSRSEGTGEGYVSSTINQDDAGITQDFDFGSLTDGADGRLPNDRAHVFKVYGNYAPFKSLMFGYNLSVISGRPTSCIGFVPPTVPDFADASAYTTASSYYCLDSTGTAQLHTRGEAGQTSWATTLDLQAKYTFEEILNGRLSLQADVFNVFNTQKEIEVSEVRDFSRASSNALTGNQLSQNYGLPITFQGPRYVRFSVRYDF